MFLAFVLSLCLGQVFCDTRIIGGQNAKPGQFPHQVSIQRRGRHHCGGSLISDSVVITAAHCAYGQKPLDLRIIAGTVNLKAGNAASSGVKHLIVHPRYNPSSQDYDIALIKLNAPFKMSKNIGVIEMAAIDSNFPADTIATITGYGAVNGNLQLSNVLKYAHVQLWSRDFCNPQNVPGVTDRMVCAGHPSGQISSCQGDSGGPLTVENKLFGLVSWGFGCGAEGKPAMYTYVAAFRPWIKQNVGI